MAAQQPYSKAAIYETSLFFFYVFGFSQWFLYVLSAQLCFFWFFGFSRCPDRLLCIMIPSKWEVQTKQRREKTSNGPNVTQMVPSNT